MKPLLKSVLAILALVALATVTMGVHYPSSRQSSFHVFQFEEQNLPMSANSFMHAFHNADGDTATGTERGWYCTRNMRLERASIVGGLAATGTLQVFADQDNIVKLVCSGSKTYWEPTGDSTGGWISPSAVVTADSGDVISIFVPTGGDLPYASMVHLYFQEIP